MAFIDNQEGLPQQVCALYVITNIARLFSTTDALGILEHAKHLLLKPKTEGTQPSIENFPFIS